MPQTTVKTSPIVTPRPLRWYDRLAASLVYGLIETVSFTLRMRWSAEAQLKIPTADQAIIFCIWHNRLALSMIVYHRHLQRREQGHQMAALVSASKDGGVLARIFQHFGVRSVRGSSSRRGAQALLELTTLVERGYDVGITPDGPRGPRYVIQPGVITLAQLTGLPIVPVSWDARWKISLRSWDGFQIPLPFSSGVMRLGKQIRIARDASAEEREAARMELEEELRKITID